MHAATAEIIDLEAFRRQRTAAASATARASMPEMTSAMAPTMLPAFATPIVWVPVWMMVPVAPSVG